MGENQACKIKIPGFSYWGLLHKRERGAAGGRGEEGERGEEGGDEEEGENGEEGRRKEITCQRLAK